MDDRWCGQYAGLREEWTCAVCLELYDVPHFLKACRHMFCKRCITDYHSRRTRLTKSTKAPCPMCRASCKKKHIKKTKCHNALNTLDRIRSWNSNPGLTQTSKDVQEDKTTDVVAGQESERRAEALGSRKPMFKRKNRNKTKH